MSADTADTADTIKSAAGPDTAGAELETGLEAGRRFRCEGCGNLTRFDVVATTRSRAFHHFDLGGSSVVEEEDVLERVIESVTCRWCGRSDAIRVEPAPAAASRG